MAAFLSPSSSPPSGAFHEMKNRLSRWRGRDFHVGRGERKQRGESLKWPEKLSAAFHPCALHILDFTMKFLWRDLKSSCVGLSFSLLSHHRHVNFRGRSICMEQTIEQLQTNLQRISLNIYLPPSYKTEKILFNKIKPRTGP